MAANSKSGPARARDTHSSKPVEGGGSEGRREACMPNGLVSAGGGARGAVPARTEGTRAQIVGTGGGQGMREAWGREGGGSRAGASEPTRPSPTRPVILDIAAATPSSSGPWPPRRTPFCRGPHSARNHPRLLLLTNPQSRTARSPPPRISGRAHRRLAAALPPPLLPPSSPTAGSALLSAPASPPTLPRPRVPHPAPAAGRARVHAGIRGTGLMRPTQ
jgi:hypothetical protein